MQQDRDIHALYNQLSEAELALFDSYFARELRTALDVANDQAQESGLGAADPGVVEADLIDELLLRAEGRTVEDPGIGMVPMPDGDYRIIPPTSNPFEAVDATADTGVPNARSAQRQRWLVAGAVLAVGLLTTWLSIGGSDEPSAAPPPSDRAGASAAPSRAPGSAGGVSEAEANARTAQLYGVEPVTSTVSITDADVRRAGASYPSSLEIVTTLDEATPPLTRTARTALVYRVVPSTGQLGGSWMPELAAGTAAWLNGSYVNSVFCLPPDTESTLAALPEGTTVLMRPATGDVREYRIVRVREVGRQQTEVLSQRKAGMTLLACGVPGDERVVAEAVYQPPISRELPPLAAQGNELPNYLRAEVDDIDAQLLDEQLVRLTVAVTLENLSTGEIRWDDLTDQLLVGGQVARPTGRVEWAPLDPGQRQRVVYSYVVPRDAGETVWQVLAPTGEQVDLRFAVPTILE